MAMRDIEAAKETFDAVWAELIETLPPELRVRGLTPEQRVAGLTPDELKELEELARKLRH
jgi:hypothetical protein